MDVDHMFLTFNPNSRREQNCPERLALLMERRQRIGEPRRLHWPTLTDLGQYERLYDMIPAPLARLLNVNEVVYYELTLEFFSTYRYTRPTPGAVVDYQSRDAGIQFRLGGRWHRWSIATLGERLGIYLPNEAIPEMREFESTEQRNDFWAEIAPDDANDYDPRRSKATKIRDPLLRVLHKVFAHTICGRGDSPGNVPTPDLLYLYTVVTQNPINIAQRMAEFLIDSAGKTSDSYICGGEYVTVLARSLNVLTPDTVDALTVATVGSYVNIPTLQSMILVRRTPEGAWLVGRDGVV